MENFNITTRRNIFDIQFISLIYYNYLNRKIKKKNGRIIPFCRTIIQMDKTARIELNGSLRIGVRAKRRERRLSTVKLWENAVLKTHGQYSLFYSSDIIVMENAVLELGFGASNLNFKVRCAKSIKIGNNVGMACDVTIMDSDFHKFNTDSTDLAKPVVIGDHVFIGTKATILKGVTVGEGAVIAAGSIVTKDVPARCMVAGIPAKVVKENVRWKM